MALIPTSPRGTPRVPRVLLSRPAQIAAAVPYLVGFHPHESVVAIGLSGPRHQIGLVLRLDLPAPEAATQAAGLVAAHLAHSGARLALLVVCTEQSTPMLPHRGLIDAIAAALAEREVALRDALLVRGERWWSYLCDRPECCPTSGTPTDSAGVDELAAATAWLGEVVHDSREELEQTLSPVGLFARAALNETFERVGAQLLDELSSRGWDAVAADSRRLLREAVARRTESSTILSDDEVARLALGLADVAVRDDALGWAGTDEEHAAEALWVELVRKAVPPYVAAPATLLAVHAYLRGNGAYARIALDRALDSDPGYSFARLLSDGLDRAVPPEALRKALSDTRAA